MSNPCHANTSFSLSALESFGPALKARYHYPTQATNHYKNTIMQSTSFCLALIALFLAGCASTGQRNYEGPKSGPIAVVNLFAPSIQSSAANTELDFEIFQAQADCSLKSLGWMQLTPTNYSKPINVVGDAPLFIRLDYFQTDIVLARNNRGEVKFALQPETGKTYTIEYKNNARLFDMDIWEGKIDAGNQRKAIEPLEWNERNDKIVYRGRLNCTN